MAGFEVDCADGKGEASACHYVAEFYAAVKEEYGRAAGMYAKNCKEKKYGPSCFSLGRFHRKFLFQCLIVVEIELI
jgi:cytochrome c oxidase assembly factor 7